jgi:hypothetical protein
MRSIVLSFSLPILFIPRRYACRGQVEPPHSPLHSTFTHFSREIVATLFQLVTPIYLRVAVQPTYHFVLSCKRSPHTCPALYSLFYPLLELFQSLLFFHRTVCIAVHLLLESPEHSPLPHLASLVTDNNILPWLSPPLEQWSSSFPFSIYVRSPCCLASSSTHFHTHRLFLVHSRSR